MRFTDLFFGIDDSCVSYERAELVCLYLYKIRRTADFNCGPFFVHEITGCPGIVKSESAEREGLMEENKVLTQPDACGCGEDHGHDHHDHDHGHDDACGCGEDHGHDHHEHGHDHCDDDCCCGHDHDHGHDHHEHDHDHHVPGHPDDCECELCHPHEEYCDVCGESLANCTCDMPDAANKKRVYILENLGCANCAAKMEAKIKALPEVDYATITYSTKQLRVSASDPDALLPVIQDICTSIESEVIVKKRERRIQQAAPVAEADLESRKKKKKGIDKEKLEPVALIVGAILLVIVEVIHETSGVEEMPPALIALCIIAYIILGWEIVWTALKNIPKGQIFDENFLMTIATAGALIIGSYVEAVGVILFYRLGEFFEHRAVENSRKAIMDAVDMRPDTVNLVVGDQVKVIDAGDAVVGDILLVRPGDRIPLDGVIVEGESRIDTSPVTGEPVPVTAKFGDEVTSGCVNTSGAIKIRVEKLLEESMVTKILDSVENAAATKPQMEHFITRFARIYTPIVCAVALFTAIVPSIVTGNWSHWVYTALTFLVISCPCALVLSVPLAFFSGIGAGSKLGILFKGGNTLEALKNVTTVIMDKTGTITKGNFEVQEVVPAADVDAEKLLELSAACEMNSTHPIGSSIISCAQAQNAALIRPSKVEEIAGKGIRAVTEDGEVLCGNQKLMRQFDVDISGYEAKAGGTEVLTALNGKFIGHIVISDTIKEESPAAIQAMHDIGIRTAMLTGDGEASARAVAEATGIQEVHAKLMPQDKLTQLSEIRKRNGAVMFVGDGINDAPVLAGADVGAAMGSGADAAIEAADVVFMNSSLTSVADAIEIARASTRVAMQNVVFALIIKLFVMVFGLIGWASMWFAVFADSGVAVLCVLNSVRVLYRYKSKARKQ